MSSFPIAVKSPEMNESVQFEVDLVAELAESVIDFTSRLFSRTQDKPPVELTEAHKLALARNPETPASMLLDLSNDTNSAVRNELVFNPLVPATVLFKLASDNDQFIRAQARTRISMAA
jgi:hypothetical protein